MIRPQEAADLISSALGIEWTEEELTRTGLRAVNLEKSFNTLHAGFDRKGDYPPRRYMEEPIQTGPQASARCDREK